MSQYERNTKFLAYYASSFTIHEHNVINIKF